MERAVSFGVVIDRKSGAVNRIMNPDFEIQLDLHPMSADEYMIRIAKAKYGVDPSPYGMTLAHVYKIIADLTPEQSKP
jgi:hypothetical protein